MTPARAAYGGLDSDAVTGHLRCVHDALSPDVRQRGTIGRMVPLNSSTAEKLWARVEETDGCWLWPGMKNEKGYGLVKRSTGGYDKAHRVAYASKVGPIGPGLMVCHRCDQPACVRPDHLFVGTALDNNRDRQRKGRYLSFRTVTPETVRAIRRLSNAGHSRSFVAAELGLSVSYVSRVMTGKLRTHTR